LITLLCISVPKIPIDNLYLTIIYKSHSTNPTLQITMRSQAIFIASLAGSVAAMAYAEAEARIFNLNNIARRQVASSAAAASTDAGGNCDIPTDIITILQTIPTPPADLSSALVATTITDYCATPSFTGTLSAEFSSYEQSVLSWAVSNSAALLSFESAISTSCPQIASLAGQVPVCTTAPAAGATGKTTATGATGTAKTATSGAAGSTSTATGAAPVATVMAAGGALFAGVVGLLAL
jgi:hypothetical protein